MSNSEQPTYQPFGVCYEPYLGAFDAGLGVLATNLANFVIADSNAWLLDSPVVVTPAETGRQPHPQVERRPLPLLVVHYPGRRSDGLQPEDEAQTQVGRLGEHLFLLSPQEFTGLTFGQKEWAKRVTSGVLSVMRGTPISTLHSGRDGILRGGPVSRLTSARLERELTNCIPDKRVPRSAEDWVNTLHFMGNEVLKRVTGGAMPQVSFRTKRRNVTAGEYVVPSGSSPGL